ncbi:MAG TPA: phosphohydrolase [Xanthobacteraceae bacterium]|nr:phosphohydrolase [Xanthobacteraceae bacterium]
MTIHKTRKGNWMQTYSGRKFWPVDPRADELDINDIAHALAKMCRYGGHCTRFYSVAEHCVLVARHAPRELALTALLHDASEAYLVDIPRPIKANLSNYAEIEHEIMLTVAKRYGIQWPVPDEVKRLDNAILADERAQNMATMDVPPRDWGSDEPPLHVKLCFWSPETAATEFLSSFYQYGGK